MLPGSAMEVAVGQGHAKGMWWAVHPSAHPPFWLSTASNLKVVFGFCLVLNTHVHTHAPFSFFKGVCSNHRNCLLHSFVFWKKNPSCVCVWLMLSPLNCGLLGGRDLCLGGESERDFCLPPASGAKALASLEPRLKEHTRGSQKLGTPPIHPAL